MKHKYLIVLIMIILPLMNIYSEEIKTDKKLFKHLTADLYTADRKTCGENLVEWAEDRGGYYLRFSDSAVVLRVPEYNDEDFDKLLRELGEITSYYFNSHNPDKEILTINGRLSAREKLLSEYYSLLNTADYRSTLSLEKEILSVLREIEQLKGRLKKLEHDRSYALLEINFYTEEYYNGTELSSFEWINSVDFHLLMKEGGAVE